MTAATPTKPKRTYTPEERAAARKKAKQELVDAIGTLHTDEGWLAWLDFRSNFRNYSWSNQVLLAWQKPDATQFNTYKRWKALGRTVKKGAKAAGIYVYTGNAKEQDENGEEREGRPLFRFVRCLFDVAETEGDDLPENVAMQHEKGDTHEDYYNRLIAHCEERGITVSIAPTGDAGGWYTPSTNSITLSDADDVNGRLQALIHELIHANGVGYDEFGRATAEVITESAAYIVVRGLGLESKRSIYYVGGWAGGDTKLIEAATKRIDEAAKQVEKALHG